jgi:hypothetical protein
MYRQAVSQPEAQGQNQAALKNMLLRTGVRAGGAQRQQCYIGYLSNGVVGADARCARDAGCWRGTVGNAIDNANQACINK